MRALGASLLLAAAAAAPVAPAAAPVDLAPFYSVSGIGTREQPADLDGNGNGLPLGAMPAGGTLSVGGIDFTLPDLSGPSFVPCRGQRVPVPEGRWAALHLLGAAVNGDKRQTFILEYADGRRQSVVPFSDWCRPRAAAETDALTGETRLTPYGEEPQGWAIRVRSVRLDPARKLAAVLLPREPDVLILAMSVTAEEHTAGSPIIEDEPYVEVLPAPPPKPRHELIRGPGEDEALVGFVSHYPFVKTGMREGEDLLPYSGANALVVRAAWASIEAAPGTLDFSSMQKQIDYAEEHDLSLVLVIECGPAHRPGWLAEGAAARGEAMKTAQGADWHNPAISSPYYKEEREDFLRAVCKWVRENDTSRRYTAYQNGCEWWYEAHACYNEGDLAAFAGWLADTYGDIEGVSEAWGAEISSWGDATGPGAPWRRGVGGEPDMAWHTPGGSRVPVVAGAEYELSADVAIHRLDSGAVKLQVAYWQEGASAPGWIVDGVSTSTVGGPARLLCRTTAPERAAEAELLLKLVGTGRVSFAGVDFRRADSHALNLAPNPGFDEGAPDQPDDWVYSNWLDTPFEQLITRRIGDPEAGYALLIDCRPQRQEMASTSAAWRDWVRWRYDYVAEFINGIADVLAEADPTREVGSYLTFSFANAAEWEDCQHVGVAPDVVFADSPLEALGMQLCSADGDALRITANLDLVRKLGKPMWDVDLIDFTSGVAVGYEWMNRATQRAVLHGATGIFYYCWNGTPDYDFHPDMDPTDLATMLTDARSAAGLVAGKEYATDCALVHTYVPFWQRGEDAPYNDFRDFVGWHKALCRAQLPHDIITLWELERGGAAFLERYPFVVLPDSAYMPTRAAEALSEYVKAGGKALSSGRLPRADECGRALPAEALAALASQAVRTDTKVGAEFWGPVSRRTSAGNTPPLYLPTEPEKAEVGDEPFALLQSFMDRYGLHKTIRLRPEDRHVDAALYRGADADVVYLVSMTAGHTFGGEVTVQYENAPASVTACCDFEPVAECVYSHSDGELTLSIPEGSTVFIAVVER